MDCTSKGKHLKLYVHRSRYENVLFHFLTRVLFVFLNETHADVCQQVLLDAVFLQLEDLADPVFFAVYLGACGLLILRPEVEPDSKAERVVLVLLKQETVA